MEDNLVRFRPEPLSIGRVLVEPPLILAPMAGITDALFRSIVAEHGAGLVTTEMVSVEGLRRNQKVTWDLCSHDPLLPVPLAVQIFGSDPRAAAEAARMVEDRGASILDINAGCPVKKVVRQGAGAKLLQNPDLLASIVQEVSRVVSIPVTVKIRIGWNEHSTAAIEVARRVEAAGAAAVTLHARTAAQGYSGRADWEWIRRLKESVSIPVIGNGDVDRPWKAEEMLRRTGCDGVMIGRASFGNPWLFSVIAGRWRGRQADDPPPDWKDLWQTARTHVEVFLKTRKAPAGHLRMLLIRYSKGCPGGVRLRGQLAGLERPEDMLDLFRTWVEECEATGLAFLPMKVGKDENR